MTVNIQKFYDNNIVAEVIEGKLLIRGNAQVGALLWGEDIFPGKEGERITHIDSRYVFNS